MDCHRRSAPAIALRTTGRFVPAVTMAQAMEHQHQATRLPKPTDPVMPASRSHPFGRIPRPAASAPGQAENRNPHSSSPVDRGFVPRGLSYACRRPKLFTTSGQAGFTRRPEEAAIQGCHVDHHLRPFGDIAGVGNAAIQPAEPGIRCTSEACSQADRDVCRRTEYSDDLPRTANVLQKASLSSLWKILGTDFRNLRTISGRRPRRASSWVQENPS